jgi:magnesium transporter
VGVVSLSHLLRNRRPVPITDVMEPEMKVIGIETDQEDVAFLFRQRDLTSAPVVDGGGRLVGVITIDDVVDVIDEEAEDDIMRLGGVRQDDFYTDAIETVRSRFSWLLVNLGTAILASLVIGLFDATIEQMVALAVLMPIVASMGGNAGTQGLTVAVRALATKELTAANAGRVIGKELLVGGVNGVLFAILTGLVAWFWFGDAAVALVLGLAMIVNMVVAALAGPVIPLALERLGVDPAVASGVFLTTVTDVVGFFAFLGLAAWLIL